MNKRMMPTFTHDPLNDDNAIDIPALLRDEWNAKARRCIEQVLGREMTAGELLELEDCAAHNWTLRVAVERVVGRDLDHDAWLKLTT